VDFDTDNVLADLTLKRHDLGAYLPKIVKLLGPGSDEHDMCSRSLA
jgi:hypothetical protein